jgi:hypothetical protein
MAAMSRGLGKVERYVLDRLREGHHSAGELWWLAQRRNHDEYLADHDEICQHDHACCDDPLFNTTPSQYEAVRRAVHSLQRKGLTRTRVSDGDAVSLIVELATDHDDHEPAVDDALAVLDLRAVLDPAMVATVLGAEGGDRIIARALGLR